MSIDLSEIRVLVAEDSPTQSMLIMFILQKAGFKAQAFVNGKLALDAATASKPALIISDVNMPVMGGPALTRAIRAEASLSDIKVILVTSTADARDEIEIKGCGADGYMRKPFKPDELLKCIQDVLG